MSIEAIQRRLVALHYDIGQGGDGRDGGDGESGPRSQAATLAAVLPNPRRYRAEPPSPYVQRRRDWILGQMPYVEMPATTGGVPRVRAAR